MGTNVVIGIDSSVGAAVADVLSRESQVVGRTISSSRNAGGIQLGPVTPGDVPQLIASAERVIFCGSAAGSSWEPDFGSGLASEKRLRRSVASACASANIPLTYISSDAVFDGPWMFCDESTVPKLSSPVSRQVAQAEDEILECCPGALVVRTHAVAVTAAGNSVIDRMLGTQASARSRTTPADGFGTPITAARFASALVKVHQASLTGLLHLAGAERTTAWQLAVAIARETGAPMPRPDYGVAASSPMERSLRCSLARKAANFVPPLLNELVAELVASAEESAVPQRAAA